MTFAPCVKEIKPRQDELNNARVHVEADMLVERVELVDAEAVKSQAKDLRSLLEDTEIFRETHRCGREQR